ncbi:hypothetical protein Cantr_09694 [Candida viswanathii]|uniref:Uncharacterized protein n=1 Tax=Candida viswanathii TaxID=5486 RepID=A0A367YC77_9ASCO|nr:hypothetical protein Cantr_09694 [Candida viswanathii]
MADTPTTPTDNPVSPQARDMGQQNSRSATKSLLETYITPKLIKDAKFFVAGLIIMTIHIFHYLSIIKLWLYNPDLSTSTLLGHFALFLADVIVLYYLFFTRLYPVIYAEEIALEKQQEEEHKLKKVN